MEENKNNNKIEQTTNTNYVLCAKPGNYSSKR